MLPEKELVDLCKKGKQHAQEELYDRFSAAMLAVCIRFTGNRAEAEDVLQEGFIKIFRNIFDFNARNQGSLAAWIKKIIVNTALSHIRKKKQYGFIEFPDTLPDLNIAEDYSVFEDDSPPSQDTLLKLIGELPDGYRLVFNLYVFENYSHKDIARNVGISEGTSKSQLAKARLYLQKELNTLYGLKKKQLIAI